MARYLISFDDGAMTFPEEDLPDVAEAAFAVVEEARAAGAWVFGAGLVGKDAVSVVAADGTVTGTIQNTGSRLDSTSNWVIFFSAWTPPSDQNSTSVGCGDGSASVQSTISRMTLGS